MSVLLWYISHIRGATEFFALQIKKFSRECIFSVIAVAIIEKRQE